MAMLKFLKGAQAGLETLKTNNTVTDGALYFTTDTHKIFMGVGTNSLQEYSAIEVVANIAALPAPADAIKAKFYYAEAENVFCFNYNNEWKQVNPDTGATSIEVVGDGNAVTEASYDAATRKITLTKGETFAKENEFNQLKDYVGTIPEGEAYADVTNVVAYVNKKAEETLKSAQGDTSETAASVAAALETYKSTNDPKVQANADAIADLQAANAEGGAVDTAIKSAQAAADKAQDEVDALEEKVGEVAEGTTVVEMISAAQKAGTDAAADAQAAADAAQGEIDALEAVVGTVAEGETVVGLIGKAQTAADGAQADVDALADKVGEVPEDKTVVEMISDAQSGLDTRVKAIEDDYLTSTDKEALQTQINTIMNNPDAEGAINSINEFTQYVTDHGTIADGFRADIDKNKEDIAANAKAIADQATSDAATYETKTDASAKLTEAKEYTDALANGQVKTNTEAIAANAEAIALKAAQSDLDAATDRIGEAEGKITALEGASATHALKTDVEGVQTSLGEYQTANDAAVALKANAADVYAKTETYTKDEVDQAVSDAVEAATTWGEF